MGSSNLSCDDIAHQFWPGSNSPVVTSQSCACSTARLRWLVMTFHGVKQPHGFKYFYQEQPAGVARDSLEVQSLS